MLPDGWPGVERIKATALRGRRRPPGRPSWELLFWRRVGSGRYLGLCCRPCALFRFFSAVRAGLVCRGAVGGGAEPDADEPGDADDGQDGGHIEVQAQPEEVLRGVDPQRFLEDAEGGVAGHVQREQARRPDPAVMAEPD